MSKATNEGTPVMRQYREAKRAHPDALLLFRMGDFYETFEEDAKIASRILGIALTKRGNQGRSNKTGPATHIPLAGFPHHSLDSYLHKLLAAGHKVAICEQVEDPKHAKGVVRREVVEVVTPGTTLAERYLESTENNYLAALFLNSTTVGLSLLDISTGEFVVMETDVEQLPEKLKAYNPKEILYAEGQRIDIEILLGKTTTLLTPYHDWIAEYESAYESLVRHFGTTSLKGFGVEHYTEGLSAAGAIMYYISQNNPGRKGHITAVKPIPDSDLMMLDSYTVRNLEMFKSLATQGTHGTLISILDQTRTAPGARLLKRWLYAPLRDHKAVDERLDRVEALVTDEELLKDIQSLLRGSSDMERILGRLATGRSNPREVVNLATSLEIVELVKERIDASARRHPGGTIRTLKRLVDGFQPTADIANQIRTSLVEDPPVNTSKGGYFKKGFSEELDELRRLAHSGKEWMIEQQKLEREKTGIPSLKIGFNNVFGYYIEVTKANLQKVPSHYIRKQTLVNGERFITPELKEYEEKILTAEEKILALEKELLESLQTTVVQHAVNIQGNARILAQLDIASCLAEVAVRQNYTRPVFDDSAVMDLEESRHPVVETLLPVGETFIPNDLKMDVRESQIHLITGPNMAGKSTFLRQVGLLVVMAQIGSFVPAKVARLGTVDRLFTRVGASDNLAGGESTFLVEMVETANILHNATPRSLILLDEIGRGTATYDGLAIAWAVTEFLHQNESVAAKTIFATHFHELVALGETLPRAKNFNVAVREHGNKVVFLRKIVTGGADRSYGIHVAQLAGLPPPVIQRAGEILKLLSDRESEKTTIEVQASEAPQINLFEVKEQALQEDFKRIDVDTLTPIEALNLLDKLKSKHGL